jgi:Rps23 Pro-64 3,4-dihydroxylase Tpa1-like proline 4-hydroxylase
MNRKAIAELIGQRLADESKQLANFYMNSGPIAYFVIDNLLPSELAHRIASVFPQADKMIRKNTLRENKYIASQMNQYDPLLEEVLFAFQEEPVLAVVSGIIGNVLLHPDPMLYAGGISRMEEGGFLNPHIDNSHDKTRKRWRALNLLYYVSPHWYAANGGNLEIWPHGIKDAPVTLASEFNRLVVMATHHHSLHSVSPVHAAAGRCCVSNYYFSDAPIHPAQQFHVTSFRGRPEQYLRDILLRTDSALRMALRKINRQGFFRTGHWYEKNKAL